MAMHASRIPHRASVYVLQRIDRRRFKVGWAYEPLKRVRDLPEFEEHALDLNGSRVLWLPSRPRALQVERSLHKSLGPYQSHPGHGGDGYSEWFDAVAHTLALRLLGQMPTGLQTGIVNRLEPLQSEPLAPGEAGSEVGPVDAWWGLEDLWLRLSHCVALTAECTGDEFRVIVHRFRHVREGEGGALRSAVLDINTYRWFADGAQGSYVRLLEYRGDDLVCTLASMRTIEGWPDGGDLVWQVKGCLLRLRQQARIAA